MPGGRRGGRILESTVFPIVKDRVRSVFLASARVSGALPWMTAGIAVLVVALAVPAFPFSGTPNHGPSTSTSGLARPDQPGAAVESRPASTWHPEPSISIPVGEVPEGVVCDDANGNVYVSNWGSGNISVINSTTNTIIDTISVGGAPEGGTYVAADGDIYIANTVSDNVTVINGTTNEIVRSIAVRYVPNDVTYDQMNGDLYVADEGSNNVTVINRTTDHYVTSVPVGTNPVDVAYDPAIGYVYVTNYGSANVTVINGTSNRAVASISVGVQPGGMTYDDATGDMFVANEFPAVVHYGPGTNYANVTVINGTTNQIVAEIPVQANSLSTAYDPTNGNIYVGNDGDNVTVIDGTTHAVLGTEPVGDQQSAVAYDPRNGYIYTANTATNNVTVIGAVPPLSEVSVSPASSVLGTGGSEVATATPACARGECATGITYAWHMSKTLGSLNSSMGSSVKVTAGSATGDVVLFVNATLNSRTVGASVPITIVPGLTFVNITPSALTLSPNAEAVFIAKPTCSAGVCPVDVAYFWSLTNYTLGELNFTFSNSVEYYAPTSTGSVTLHVNATAYNNTVEASAVITIKSPSSTSGFLGLPGNDGVVLVVVVVAAAVVVGILVMVRRKPQPSTLANSPP